MSSAARAVESILERSGLSKAELSRRSSISRAQIDAYLKGTTQPSVAQLERLGESAGLRLDLVWADRITVPSWGETHYEKQPPKSPAEKSRLLEIVVATAWELPHKRRGELTYPSLRKLQDAG